MHVLYNHYNKKRRYSPKGFTSNSFIETIEYSASIHNVKHRIKYEVEKSVAHIVF